MIWGYPHFGKPHIYIYIYTCTIHYMQQSVETIPTGHFRNSKNQVSCFSGTPTDGSLGIPQHCCLLQDGRILRLSVAIQLQGDLTGQPVLAAAVKGPVLTAGKSTGRTGRNLKNQLLDLFFLVWFGGSEQIPTN